MGRYKINSNLVKFKVPYSGGITIRYENYNITFNLRGELVTDNSDVIAILRMPEIQRKYKVVEVSNGKKKSKEDKKGEKAKTVDGEEV